MRTVVQRFFDWIFHAGVRRDPMPRGKALLYRYPSPGSILPQDGPRDYRTPFTDTPYDIRRNTLTHYQTRERVSEYKAGSAAFSPVKKLTLLGFLKQGEENNSTAVQEASKKFKEAYGFSVQQSAFKNDFELNMPKPGDRESYRQAVSKQFAVTSLFNRQYMNSDPDHGNDKINVVEFQSLDLFDAPHFQQGRIQNAYTLDKLSNYRANTEGGLDARKGEAKFWKALDDLNDSQNVRKVQEKIGDDEPNNFNLKNAKIHFEFDKDGNVVDIHRKK